jgi:tight adherence protein B
VKAVDFLVIAFVASLVFAAALVALRARTVSRLRKRLEPHVRAVVSDEPKAARRKLFAPLFEVTERAFGKVRVWAMISAALERADWSMGPAQFFYLVLGAGFVPAFLLALAGAPGVLAVLAVPVGAGLPVFILHSKGTKRQQTFDEQLPQLLLTMGASVRVGHSFRQSMQAVVQEGLDPASKEFGRVLLETDLGRPVDDALTEMAKRLGSQNFEYVIHAVSIQREAGGSLGELLDLVSETVRHRQQFSAKVRALTAMGRLSAYILSVLPFVAVALLTAINPNYTKPLFATSTGHFLIFLALFGITVGFLVLRRMVSFRLS